jgi:cell division protein FtsB
MSDREIADVAHRLHKVRADLSDLQARREILAAQIAAISDDPIPSNPTAADVARANARHNYAYALADYDRQLDRLADERDSLETRLAALQG